MVNSRIVAHRARLKPDGTRAETRFRLSPKRTSPIKSAGASVQSTAGSRDVRISVSNAGYATFRGSVRVLATHSIRQFPLHFPVRHRVPSGFKRAILNMSETVQHISSTHRKNKLYIRGTNKCFFDIYKCNLISLLHVSASRQPQGALHQDLKLTKI